MTSETAITSRRSLRWPTNVMLFSMPATLIAVLASSLLLALLFIPVLGGAIGGTPPAGGERAWQPGDPLTGWTGRYVQLLEAMLRHAGKVMLAAVLLLFGSIGLYGRCAFHAESRIAPLIMDRG